MIKLPFDRTVMLVTPTYKERLNNYYVQASRIYGLEKFNSIYIPKVHTYASMLNKGGMFEWNCVGNGTALNCMLNHYTIVKQCYIDGLDSVFVMEDDVEIISDDITCIDIISHLPSDYDIIRFDWHKKTCPYVKNPKNYFTKSYKNVYGTQCYVLNRTGMLYYINFIENTPAVADHPLFCITENSRVNQYFCDKDFCLENESFDTSIQKGDL